MQAFMCHVVHLGGCVQVYPEGARQATLLTDAAMRAGFSGGLVVDFPHSTRAKKYFLVRGLQGILPQGHAGELLCRP